MHCTFITIQPDPIVHADSPDTSLLEGLRAAGSSMGIVTEFKYRYYDTPHKRSATVLVFMEEKEDIEKLAEISRTEKYKLQEQYRRNISTVFLMNEATA